MDVHGRRRRFSITNTSLSNLNQCLAEAKPEFETPGSQRGIALGYTGQKVEDVMRGESRSFGDKPVGSPRDDELRQQVREHVSYRMGEGAHSRDVAHERHVQRNVARVEVQESLNEPSRVEAVHTRQGRSSSLRGLAQRLRAPLSSTRRVDFQASSLIRIPYRDDRFFVATSSFSGSFASSTLTTGLAV